ncbi:MAG: DUF1080 domain-containing protein [Planctomycetota bacterium]
MNRNWTNAAGSLLLFTFAWMISTSVSQGADQAQGNGDGFVSLFDGKSLKGWKLVNKKGPGYVIENGVLVCPADGGGNLYTEKEYSDFILRFDYRLAPGGNNGVGIRAPLEGDAAYVGMEIQILDNDDPEYANLRPEQYHGSVYDLFGAKRGVTKKAGEWNSEEIVCNGRHVKVTLNGTVIVDANLDDIKDPEKLKKHPGIARAKGHIGFLGHGTRVEFKNISLRDLSK